jgi:hypothetical protein
MAFINFDSTNIAPDTSREPIPAGTYLSHITESDLVSAKSGNGQNLKLTFEVLDGQFKGRKIYETLCVQHTNGDTQRIAQAKLSAICHATGLLRVQDSSELHYKPIKLNVTVQPPANGYDAQNRIKGYEAANPAGAYAPQQFAPQQPQQFAPPPAAPASGAPAWAAKK